MDQGVFFGLGGGFIIEDAATAGGADGVGALTGAEQGEFASGFEADISGISVDIASHRDQVFTGFYADMAPCFEGIADDAVMLGKVTIIMGVVEGYAAKEDVTVSIEGQGVSTFDVCPQKGHVFFSMERKAIATLKTGFSQGFGMVLEGVAGHAPGVILGIYKAGDEDRATGLDGKIFSCNQTAAFKGEATRIDAEVTASLDKTANVGNARSGISTSSEGVKDGVAAADALAHIHILYGIEGEIASYLQVSATTQVELATGNGSVLTTAEVEVLTLKLAADITGTGFGDGAGLTRTGISAGGFGDLAVLTTVDGDILSGSEGKVLALT